MTDPRNIGSIALLAISMLLAGSALLPALGESTGSAAPKEGATKQGAAPQCNPAALNMLKKLDPEEEIQEKKDNPIWKGLEKFRDLGS